MQILLSLLTAAFVVILIYWFSSTNAVFVDLEKNHPDLFKELASPKVLSTGTDSANALASLLFGKEGNQLNGTAIGNKLKTMRWVLAIGFAIFSIIVIICLRSP